MKTPISTDLARRCGRGLVVAFAALSGVAVCGLAADAANSKQWHADLADQMKVDYACDVGFMSQVNETVEEGTPLIVARVHCLDGRAYDVRRHKEAVFAVKPCRTEKLTC